MIVMIIMIIMIKNDNNDNNAHKNVNFFKENDVFYCII